MEFKIKEIGRVVTGSTPSKKHADSYGTVMPFLTPKDMDKNKYNSSTERLLSEKGLKLLSNKLCSPVSVSVSCIGSDMGKTCYNQVPVITNQQINTITDIDKSKFNPDFIYYLLTTKKEYFHSIAGGSTMPIINKTDFENIVLDIPDINTQNKVGDFLSLFDKKIWLNEQIISNLEQLAQTLFKYWLVDFEFPNENGEPYKSSGGEMVESEYGMIPNGWIIKKLGEFISLTKGLSYKSTFLDKEGNSNTSFPMISLSNFHFIAGFKREKTKMYYGPHNERHILEAGDIVIAATDVTQDRKILGSPAIVPALSNKMIFSLDVFRVSKSKLPQSFLYYTLQTPNYRERVEGFATGTTVLRIRQEIILEMDIIIPKDMNLLSKFDYEINAIFKKIEILEDENENLANLRDTLLPKLLSGELELANESEVIDDVSVS